MELLRIIESARTPFLDAFFGSITHLGGETVFMAVSIVIFWCISKKHGYFILMTGFLGTILNQFLKLLFRIPRPWVIDKEFTVVESAQPEATGYSFPSGHTQNVTTTFGGIARVTRNKLLRICSIAIVLLVAFSRMYLGVHTLLDVGVSLALGTILLLVFYPMFSSWYDSPKKMNVVIGVMVLLTVAFTLFCEFNNWPADIDPHNLASGIKNAYTLLGASCGMWLAYNIDRKYINFDVKACFAAQVVKVVLGLAAVVGIKAVLKAPLMAVFAGHGMAHFVRYFIMVMFAAVVWPLCFPFINKLFAKKDK